jgi:SprT protein
LSLSDHTNKGKQFLLKKIFPADIDRALLRTLQNPAASSCADVSLLRVLHKYDDKDEGIILVEAVPDGKTFRIKGGKIFRRIERVRKRIKCVEVVTGKIYLFSPVYEVEMAE